MSEEYILRKHPLFDLDLCCFFAGRLMVMPKEVGEFIEPRKLAGINFVAIYRTLSVQEKTLVREAIKDFKTNPKQAGQYLIDHINDTMDDDDLLKRIRESDL